ncbi:hypothetical protein BG004_007217, partial [Podila humilis]
MDVSVKQEEMMAKEAYKQVMHQVFGGVELEVLLNHAYTHYVKRVAGRIIQAAGMQNLDWEFHVIASDEKNAFVLPGGKVFVFTGILPIAENENGLATVLGHEIAHQLARHSAEKLSFTKIAMFFGVLVSLVFDPSWSVQRIMMELGMLQHHRVQTVVVQHNEGERLKGGRILFHISHSQRKAAADAR